MFYVVSLFLLNRAYGGPEEGGWWYTIGEVVDPKNYPIIQPPNPGHGCQVRPEIFNDKQNAEHWAKAWTRDYCSYLNDSRNSDLGSVLCEGRYEFLVTEGWPEDFPQTRPHYE